MHTLHAHRQHACTLAQTAAQVHEHKHGVLYIYTCIMHEHNQRYKTVCSCRFMGTCAETHFAHLGLSMHRKLSVSKCALCSYVISGNINIVLDDLGLMKSTLITPKYIHITVVIFLLCMRKTNKNIRNKKVNVRVG